MPDEYTSIDGIDCDPLRRYWGAEGNGSMAVDSVGAHIRLVFRNSCVHQYGDAFRFSVIGGLLVNPRKGFIRYAESCLQAFCIQYDDELSLNIRIYPELWSLRVCNCGHLFIRFCWQSRLFLDGYGTRIGSTWATAVSIQGWQNSAVISERSILPPGTGSLYI